MDIWLTLLVISQANKEINYMITAEVGRKVINTVFASLKIALLILVMWY
jgi:hypothetical protein